MVAWGQEFCTSKPCALWMVTAFPKCANKPLAVRTHSVSSVSRRAQRGSRLNVTCVSSTNVSDRLGRVRQFLSYTEHIGAPASSCAARWRRRSQSAFLTGVTVIAHLLSRSRGLGGRWKEAATLADPAPTCFGPERPSNLAIDRADCCAVAPLEITSRSASVSASLERRRWAGRIPPCGATKK
jgi:hypothetical protein